MQSHYDLEAVRPMWEELAAVGIQSLKTAQDVDDVLGKGGTALVVVNSVCGCAAGNARPGTMLALQHNKIPDQITTVFAGVDHESVYRAREHMSNVPPSSPCIALFKDKKPVFVLERRHIESMTAQAVAQALTQAFDQHCARNGPSIPPEQFAKIAPVAMCGSNIPTNQPS